MPWNPYGFSVFKISERLLWSGLLPVTLSVDLQTLFISEHLQNPIVHYYGYANITNAISDQQLIMINMHESGFVFQLVSWDIGILSIDVWPQKGHKFLFYFNVR